jgi:hypothetical protein
MTESIVQVIEEWMSEWIVKENFCPFAKPALQQNQVKIQVCHSNSWSQVLESLSAECNALLEREQYTTCLLVLTACADDFFDYLALLEAAQKRIENEGWLGVFQLASFHPDYLFESESVESVSHFTNRAPLPIIHILQEQEIDRVMPREQAAQEYAERIVERNIQRLEQIGIEAAKAQLDQWQRKIASITQSAS